MAFNGFKGRGKRSASTAITLLGSEIDSADVMQSSACYPTDVKMKFAIYSEKNASLSITTDHVLCRQNQSPRDKMMVAECSNSQDDDVGSPMYSENGRQPKQKAELFKDRGSPRSMEKNLRGKGRMGTGLSVVSGFGAELDGFDLRRYSMSMQKM